MFLFLLHDFYDLVYAKRVLNDISGKNKLVADFQRLMKLFKNYESDLV